MTDIRKGIHFNLLIGYEIHAGIKLSSCEKFSKNVPSIFITQPSKDLERTMVVENNPCLGRFTCKQIKKSRNSDPGNYFLRI